ncbi:unnamed protein product [Phytomonas sp. EM1]|nr:unnamed protein product [Phytomonas sp. EM1]|eukprot:CCW60455.1 unnamed protein product [Phytomonas sp. isolate EM1]
MYQDRYINERSKVYQGSASRTDRLSYIAVDDNIPKLSHSHFSNEDSRGLVRSQARKRFLPPPPPSKSPERYLSHKHQHNNSVNEHPRASLRASPSLSSSYEYSYEYIYSNTSCSTSSSASRGSSTGAQGGARSDKISRREIPSGKDLELAAAAACNAILEKEKSLKLVELKLLNEKQKLLEEVKRRTSMHNNADTKDNTIACLEKLVISDDSIKKPGNYLLCESPKPRPVDEDSVGAAGDHTRSITCGDANQPTLNGIHHPLKANRAFNSHDTSFRHSKEGPETPPRERNIQTKSEAALQSSHPLQNVAPQDDLTIAGSTQVFSDRTAFIRLEHGKIVKDVTTKQHAVTNIENHLPEKLPDARASSEPDGNTGIPTIVSVPVLTKSLEPNRIGVSEDTLPVFDASLPGINETKTAPHVQVDGVTRATVVSPSDVVFSSGGSVQLAKEESKGLHTDPSKISEQLRGSPGTAGSINSFVVKQISPSAFGGRYMSPKIDESSVESLNPPPERQRQVIQCAPIPYYSSTAQSLKSAHSANQGSRPSQPITLTNPPMDRSNRFLWDPNAKTVSTRSKGIKDFLCAEYVSPSNSHEPVLPTEPAREEDQTTAKDAAKNHDSDSRPHAQPDAQPMDPPIFEPFVEESTPQKMQSPRAQHQSDNSGGGDRQTTFLPSTEHVNGIPNTVANHSPHSPCNSLIRSGSSSVEFPTPPRAPADKKGKPCCCGRYCTGCRKGKNNESGPRRLMQCLVPWFKRNKKDTSPHQPTKD